MVTKSTPISIGKTHDIYEIRENGIIVFLDLKTGELIEKHFYDVDTHILLSKKYLDMKEKFKNNCNNRLKDSRGCWYNVPTKSNEELVLTLTDRAFIIFLSLYINYNEVLMKDGKPLRNQDIAELWKVYDKNGNKDTISTKKINERLSNLVNKDVLLRIPDKTDNRFNNYKFNKSYIYQGEQPGNEKFVKVFQKKLMEVIEKLRKIEKKINNYRKVSKIDIMPVIGILHSIMPYVHSQTGYIVKNPNDLFDVKIDEPIYKEMERNPGLLKKLPKSIISRSLGYTEMKTSTLNTYFQYLADAGALKIDDTEGVKMYLIHPDLMYGKDTGAKEHLADLRAKFGIHANQDKDEK